MESLRVDCPPTHLGKRITFCGEAPGEDEAWQKRGFVGKSGRVLTQICRIAGLGEDDFNRTNVVKRRPPRNDFRSAFYHTVIPEGKRKGRVEPTPELVAWINRLKQELEQQRPGLVVACGEHAFRALVSDCPFTITKVQGSVYDSTLVPGVKVMPMEHPSAILRTGGFDRIYQCGRFLKSVAIPESLVDGPLHPSWESVQEPTVGMVEEVVKEAAARQWRWCIDIETRGRGIACLGLGFCCCREQGELAMVVPIETTTGPWYTAEQERQVWSWLQYLSDNNPNLVVQNGPFDFEWLMDYGFVPDDVLMDTMTAHHLLYPELRQGLAFTNVFYATGIQYYKDDGKTWGKRDPDRKLWLYNEKDVISELRISYPIEDELRERNWWDDYQNRRLPTLPLALEMQRRGFPVDWSGVKWTRSLLMTEWTRIHERLTKQAGRDVNVNSTSQVPELLYQQLGFPHLYGKRNADEDVLVTMKTWLAGQRPKAHTKYCEGGKKKCEHRSMTQLKKMGVVLDCVMKERKLLKSLSNYLSEKVYTTATTTAT